MHVPYADCQSQLKSEIGLLMTSQLEWANRYAASDSVAPAIDWQLVSVNLSSWVC